MDKQEQKEDSIGTFCERPPRRPFFHGGHLDSRSIALKAFIQASMFGLVALLVMLLLNAAQVLLLVFAGILFALLLRGMTDWVTCKTGMPDGVALALAIAVPLLVIGIAVWLIAPAVGDQASRLADRLPQAAAQLKGQLLQYSWVQQLWDHKERIAHSLPSESSGASVIAQFFTTTFGALGNLAVVLFLGVFLAINPDWYVDGAVRLFPVERRERTRTVLQQTGETLGSWLIAKLTTMSVIGVFTTIGLWLLGIDLALVLGVIAALLSFIPNFGPIASVIPAALIGLVASPEKALYVLLLYASLQTVESYLLTPILQQHMVNLPPALLMTMQVLLGVTVGILGVILAVPMTAAGMVLVRMWYVEDALEGNA